jgi:putative methyltransferase (TIGR04325 family)
LKNFLRDILPPALYRALRMHPFRRYGWFGDYSSWDEAQRHCVGYDNAIILEKVKNALLKVKNGEAAFERDSVLFDSPEYEWPILSWLTWVAALNHGRLNVLDFGGSLGSTYFQNRQFLKNIPDIKWNVVEQPHFVEEGRRTFQDEQLRFYYTVDECLKENKVDIALLSSVLPYIPEPYKQLEVFSQIEFIILDKTPLIATDRDRLTVQKVPPSIYQASYPAWFFSEQKFYNFATRHHEIVAEVKRDLYANFPAAFKAILLRKIK